MVVSSRQGTPAAVLADAGGELEAMAALLQRRQRRQPGGPHRGLARRPRAGCGEVGIEAGTGANRHHDVSFVRRDRIGATLSGVGQARDTSGEGHCSHRHGQFPPHWSLPGTGRSRRVSAGDNASSPRASTRGSGGRLRTARRTARPRSSAAPGRSAAPVARPARPGRSIAFWLSGARVVSGMNVNVWDVVGTIQRRTQRLPCRCRAPQRPEGAS